jgi:hypothetical protein
MAMRKQAGMNQGRVSCLTLKSRRHTLHAMSFCSRQDAVLPCIGPGKRCKRHWWGRRLRHPERSAMIHGPPNVTCVARNHDMYNGKCQHSMHLAQQSGAQRQNGIIGQRRRPSSDVKHEPAWSLRGRHARRRAFRSPPGRHCRWSALGHAVPACPHPMRIGHGQPQCLRGMKTMWRGANNTRSGHTLAKEQGQLERATIRLQN